MALQPALLGIMSGILSSVDGKINSMGLGGLM
jgi:hypothetical protein